MAQFKITIIAEAPDDECGVLDEVQHSISNGYWPDGVKLSSDAEDAGYAVTVEEWDGEPV